MPGGLVAPQDRLDDVRHERGQPQQPADAGAVDAVGMGEVVEAGGSERPAPRWWHRDEDCVAQPAQDGPR